MICLGLPWPRRQSLPLRLRAAQQAWAAQLLALVRLHARNAGRVTRFSGEWPITPILGRRGAGQHKQVIFSPVAQMR